MYVPAAQPPRDPTLEFQGSFAPPKPSLFWRGIRVVVGLAAETPLAVIGFLILGIVLNVLMPPLAGCCFAISLGTLSSKLLWKILTKFRFEFFNLTERKALAFQKNHPYLQAASVAAAFALTILSPLASCLAGAAVGIFNGIIAEANHRFILIEKNRREEEELAPRQLNAALSC